jgi:hypothetical protein
VGQLPLAAPLRLDKGKVEIKVSAPGHLATTESVIVTGGKREERTFTLSRDPATAPAASTEPNLALGANSADNSLATTATPTVEATPAPSGNPRRGLRLAAWITGGAALGALVFGTIETFVAASARNDFNNHMGTVNGVYGRDCGTGNLSPECKPLKDAYDQAVTLSIVGFAAAGALAAGASVMFVLSSPNRSVTAESTGSAHALACVPDLWTRGLSCSLRF